VIEMADRTVNTVPTDKGWANRAGTRPISNHRTKTLAQKAGRKQAIERRAMHVIHKQDGSVASKHSYGNDTSR
jgi:hypothetical protein